MRDPVHFLTQRRNDHGFRAFIIDDIETLFAHGHCAEKLEPSIEAVTSFLL